MKQISILLLFIFTNTITGYSQSQKPQEKLITIQFTEQELNKVYEALGKQPANEVFALLLKIQLAYNTQNQPVQPINDSTKKAQPKPEPKKP